MRLDDARPTFLDGRLRPTLTPSAATWSSLAVSWSWPTADNPAVGFDPPTTRAAMTQKQDPNNHSLNFKGGESVARTLASGHAGWRPGFERRGCTSPISAWSSRHAPERIQLRLRRGGVQGPFEESILQRSNRSRSLHPATGRSRATWRSSICWPIRASVRPRYAAWRPKHVDFKRAPCWSTTARARSSERSALWTRRSSGGGVKSQLLADWIEMRLRPRCRTKPDALVSA